MISPVVDRLSTFRVIGVAGPFGAFVYVDGVLVPVEDAGGVSCPICDAEFDEETGSGPLA